MCVVFEAFYILFYFFLSFSRFFFMLKFKEVDAVCCGFYYLLFWWECGYFIAVEVFGERESFQKSFRVNFNLKRFLCSCYADAVCVNYSRVELNWIWDVLLALYLHFVALRTFNALLTFSTDIQNLNFYKFNDFSL